MAQLPPVDWRKDMVCPHCGAPISDIHETMCPYCHEALPAAAVLAERDAVVNTNRVWLIAVAALMLVCCWPVGAVMMMIIPTWRRNVRLAIVLGSLVVWVAACTPYWYATFSSCVSGPNGSLRCGSSTSTSPSPYRVR
jgi:hypothetical protein